MPKWWEKTRVAVVSRKPQLLQLFLENHKIRDSYQKEPKYPVNYLVVQKMTLRPICQC
jgi:hypothetical protein